MDLTLAVMEEEDFLVSVPAAILCLIIDAEVMSESKDVRGLVLDIFCSFGTSE